jgi:hypothetical protein
MPVAGGDTVMASDYGYRVTTPVIANGALITTVEAVVATVTASLVSGRRYKIVSKNRGGSTVANDTILMRLREDNLTGTELDVGRIFCPDLDGAAHGPCYLEAEYLALATAAKSFVLCATRRTGTGNINLRAGATSPALLYVENLPL